MIGNPVSGREYDDGLVICAVCGSPLMEKTGCSFCREHLLGMEDERD